MNTDLNCAKERLLSTGSTCVLCRQAAVYESSLRGVAPLLALLDSGRDMTGFSAADKVVGKGAAFLYCLLGVSAVYAPVISQAALCVLERHGVKVQYDLCVAAIFNRRRDGYCPIETATKDLEDPYAALAAIRRTLDALQRP